MRGPREGAVKPRTLAQSSPSITFGAGGTADAAVPRMITKKSVSKLLKGLIVAAPTIPYLVKRRRTPIAAYILGGIGFVIAGGVAALMIFSPRTRTRALGAAKDTYGKVNEKVSHLRHRDAPMSNGLVDRSEYANTTGL